LKITVECNTWGTGTWGLNLWKIRDFIDLFIAMKAVISFID
jgi:hypothetical protein